MESELIECGKCGALPSEMQGYTPRTCRLCGALGCDECLNEAGYCAPCGEKREYSYEEAVIA